MNGVNSRDGIVLSLENGTIQKMNTNGEVVQWVQPTEHDTIIKVINDEIVASVFDGILILNAEFHTVKRFHKTENRFQCFAQCIGGNAEYIAIVTLHHDRRVQFYRRDGDNDHKATVRKQTNVKS